MRFSIPRFCSVFVFGSVLAVCFSLPAHALQVDGVELPDTFAYEGQTLTANGSGTRLYSFLKIKVYSATLYLPVKNSNPEQILASKLPRVLHLKMRVDAKRDDAMEAWAYYLKQNCSSPCKINPQSQARFLDAQANLKEGDTETYFFTAQGLMIKRNGQDVLNIGDADFANLVLAGWLGKEPTTEALKAKLLGN
ncbi:MAG: chalcone isomerase family protein [Limnobacter sp.]|nr:chalcone isomerase family protein [Limnobacter sp.]